MRTGKGWARGPPWMRARTLARGPREPGAACEQGRRDRLPLDWMGRLEAGRPGRRLG